MQPCPMPLPMNPVENRTAVVNLASKPFQAAEFPIHFLAAFSRRQTALQRLRTCNPKLGRTSRVRCSNVGKYSPSLGLIRMPKAAIGL